MQEEEIKKMARSNRGAAAASAADSPDDAADAPDDAAANAPAADGAGHPPDPPLFRLLLLLFLN